MVIKYIHTCQRCGHEWESELEHPRQCPKCWSRNWDKEVKP
jgi:predicted Zn-ribbon and HTH transcriptional regulator